MSHAVTLIPGDGIGPEISAATRKVLEATGVRFDWDDQVAGMAAVLAATSFPLRTRPVLRGRWRRETWTRHR